MPECKNCISETNYTDEGLKTHQEHFCPKTIKPTTDKED